MSKFSVIYFFATLKKFGAPGSRPIFNFMMIGTISFISPVFAALCKQLINSNLFLRMLFTHSHYFSRQPICFHVLLFCSRCEIPAYFSEPFPFLIDVFLPWRFFGFRHPHTAIYFRFRPPCIDFAILNNRIIRDMLIWAIAYWTIFTLINDKYRFCTGTFTIRGAKQINEGEKISLER